jgi:hypothetical protein
VKQAAQAVAVRITVAHRFKAEIEQAALEGVPLADLTLNLTIGDIEQLKRDRTIPLADISFAGGAMTYLGVNIVKAAAPPSTLRRQEADEA